MDISENLRLEYFINYIISILVKNLSSICKVNTEKIVTLSPFKK